MNTGISLSRGRRAETQATRYLEAQGYYVVVRNYRVKEGEIDIIAVCDGILCFVEVRQRSDVEHGTPEESIVRFKRRRIVKAAEHYLATRMPEEEPLCRFDVVAVSGDDITLIHDAFRLEDC